MVAQASRLLYKPNTAEPQSVIEFESMGATAFVLQFGGFGGPGGRRGPGEAGDFQPPVSLNLTGIRQSDGERISLSLSVDPDSFNKTGEAVDVSGRVTVGQPQRGGFGFGGGRSIQGKIHLTKSGTEVGDAVVGTVDLRIVESPIAFAGSIIALSMCHLL